jgi:hypothetical protein
MQSKIVRVKKCWNKKSKQDREKSVWSKEVWHEIAKKGFEAKKSKRNNETSILKRKSQSKIAKKVFLSEKV